LICIYNDIDSTNTHLLNLLNLTKNAINIKDFSAILALKQNAGYGKYNRKWETLEGNLALSFFLSSDKIDWLAENNMSFLAILLGIFFVEKLNSYFNNNTSFFLKYPNDIMLNDKKIGGFLIESSVQGNQVRLVCGIGLNLLHSPDSIPNTTSIYQDTKKIITQNTFAEEIIDLLKRELYNRIKDKKKIIIDFYKHSFLKFNDSITIKLRDGKNITGLYQTLSHDASLILLLPNNQIIKISHGDIFI